MKYSPPRGHKYPSFQIALLASMLKACRINRERQLQVDQGLSQVSG